MTDIEQFLMSLRTHKDADGKLNPIYLADTIQKEIEIIQEAIKHSQRWVGLTNEEVGEFTAYVYAGDPQYVRLIETKLKDKNK
jgi:hypothetical protein